MPSMFSARFLRKAAAEGPRVDVLDAGCGSGTAALYLARRIPYRSVHGYDMNTDAIAAANSLKSKHGIPNVYFSAASHESFVLPHLFDMVYTDGSLATIEEIPEDPGLVTPTHGVELLRETLTKRFSRFSEMLKRGGVYINVGRGSRMSDDRLVEFAESCGLKGVNYVIDYDQHYGYEPGVTSPLPVYRTALVFERR